MSKKPGWLFHQSGVVPFRRIDSRIDILVITSRKKKHWIFPKGVVERFMTPEASGRKEALEEAGVDGVVDSTLLGVYEQKKWGGTCRVKMYPMEVTGVLDDYDEAGARERRWVSIEEARELIDSAGLLRILEEFEAFVRPPPSGDAT